jgi:Tetratricopeptide repeat
VLFEKSRDLLLKAIALDPNDALTYSLLGVVYSGLSDWDRCVAMLDPTFSPLRFRRHEARGIPRVCDVPIELWC